MRLCTHSCIHTQIHTEREREREREGGGEGGERERERELVLMWTGYLNVTNDIQFVLISYSSVPFCSVRNPANACSDSTFKHFLVDNVKRALKHGASLKWTVLKKVNLDCDT